MAVRDQTLPISESRADGESAPVSLLILIGQSCNPRQPVARIVPLRGQAELLVGRGEEQKIVDEGTQLCYQLVDQWMSAQHARIRCFQAGAEHWCVLEDLGSTNGCRVNGVPVKRHQLQHGDLIETGQTFWKLYQQPEQEFEELQALAVSGGEPGPGSSVSPLMLRQLLQLGRIAGTEIPVILMGESGTGKEVVSTLLHGRSGRAGKLVALNCAAIPPALMESELFGHRKGAFTGAYCDKRGVIEEAEGGTLLLDEIGDLPLEVQAKLLRLLQERSFLRVGETVSRRAEVRFVAATNMDLEQMVAQGRFRGDLFARLNGLCLRLPSLHQRKEDLGLLLTVFLKDAPPELELSLEAYRALLSYNWPYNIRELQKCIATAVAMAAGSKVIRASHLPDALRARGGSQEPKESPAAAPSPEEGGSRGGLRFGDQARRPKLLELLDRHRGNLAAVARELRTSRAQIHRLLRRAGIDHRGFRGGD